MPLRIGETFAGYRILRLLGSGGMGEVYLVQHPRLPRRDALKVLRPDVSSDASYRERFVREADLAAGLRHSHIVGIHDRGEYNSQLWIAMDYIEGTDAAQFMERRYPAGMPTDLVAHIVTAVASALDYAHKKGLLHRDVKPANMIVADIDTDDPSVFLADFGIARPLDDTSGITTTNMTVGTVAYAAPEQLMGESIDGRADQYALAATIYHLLTGLQLFPQSNPAVVISRHLNTTPPRLSDRRTDLAGLDAVLRSALAKNPDDRFSSCTAFARAFAEQVRPTGDAASPAAPTQFAPVPRDENTPTASPGQLHRPWQRRPVIVGAVVAALLLIGASVSIPLLTRSDRDTSAARTQSAEATTSSQDISISPSRTSISPSTSVMASSGSFPTIVDYIRQNGIVETPVHRGDPGSPTINLPFPPGWADAGSRTPNWAYGAMLFSDPAMAADPPTVIALVSKLTGNVDAAEILMYAPNEIKNLPGYNGAEAGTPSTLGGFDATQIGGTYTKDGVRRAIAQKTVVIPGKGGLYVLQLNADGTEDQMGTLMDATSVIDQQTKITP
jgi:serine/threonine-protein kinase